MYYLKLPLKVLNPFIWVVNHMKYAAHLDGQRFNEKYEPYDFNTDIKYF